MFARFAKTLTGRQMRKVLPLGLLAFAWAAWWLWPPQPEVRQFEHVGTFGNEVTSADGKTVLKKSEDELPDDESGLSERNGKWEHSKLTRIKVVDAQASNISADLRNVRLDFELSPDGTRLAYRDQQKRWHVLAVPSGEPLPELPESLPESIIWTPDSRHVIFHDARVIKVCRATDGKMIARFATSSERCILLPDGTGLVAASANHRFLHVWKFYPAWIVDTVELPRPLTDLDSTWSDLGPPANSMALRRLFMSRDGTAIAATATHIEPEGDGLTLVATIEYWDRRTGRHVSIKEHGSEVPGRSEELWLSPNGRFLGTNRWYVCGYRVSDPKWERLRERIFEAEQILWDMNSQKPLLRRSFPWNDHEVIRAGKAGGKVAIECTSGLEIFDSNTLELIKKIDGGQNYRVQLDDRDEWAAASVLPTPNEWLPTWAKSLLEFFVGPATSTTAFIRLSTGQITRQVPGDFSHFDKDGKIWTALYPKPGTDPDAKMLRERWSAESPPPPWWLIVITVAGIGVMSLQFLRAPLPRRG